MDDYTPKTASLQLKPHEYALAMAQCLGQLLGTLANAELELKFGYEPQEILQRVLEKYHAVQQKIEKLDELMAEHIEQKLRRAV